MRFSRPLLLAAFAVLLSGCAAWSPLAPPSPPATARLPDQWQAPFAHGGSVAQMAAWWGQLGDDTLPELVALAQAASPSLSAAAARLEQARAEQIAGQAALGPSLTASAAATRGNAQYPLPLSRTGSASLAASWEADLFGADRLALKAADARAASAQAQWHDARVLVAAETAVQYLSLRYCEALRDLLAEDLRSLETLSRLSALTATAGLGAPALAEQARANQAGANARLLGQQASCDIDIKALVSLTGLAEPDLRSRLTRHAGRRFDLPPALSVQTVPAQVIAQRPDVFAAEREIVATASEVGQAQALRLPRLSLGGSIGAFSVRGGPLAADLSTWSLGPIRLQMPVYDGGTSEAQVRAARARFDDAVRQYEARVRQAIREVEEALVQSHFTRQRLDQIRQAKGALERALQATRRRAEAGLESRQALEEAQRAVTDIRINELAVIREGLIAGVSLYRAAGGGWDSR